MKTLALQAVIGGFSIISQIPEASPWAKGSRVFQAAIGVIAILYLIDLAVS